MDLITDSKSNYNENFFQNLWLKPNVNASRHGHMIRISKIKSNTQKIMARLQSGGDNTKTTKTTKTATPVATSEAEEFLRNDDLWLSSQTSPAQNSQGGGYGSVMSPASDLLKTDSAADAVLTASDSHRMRSLK